jgi:hypothetical protein
MESILSTPLDKYLEDGKLLQNCYGELKDQINNGGLLETLANIVVKGEGQSLNFRKVYFHGKAINFTF